MMKPELSEIIELLVIGLLPVYLVFKGLIPCKLEYKGENI